MIPSFVSKNIEEVYAKRGEEEKAVSEESTTKTVEEVRNKMICHQREKEASPKEITHRKASLKTDEADKVQQISKSKIHRHSKKAKKTDQTEINSDNNSNNSP